MNIEDYNLQQGQFFNSSELDEDMKGNLISLALGASLLAIPNILRAEDIVRSATTKNGVAVELQDTIHNAQQDKVKKYGGYTQAEAANVVARTIFHEGRGEGNKGRHYIATAIWNRAGHDPQNLVSVCFRRKQFSVWNAAEPSTTSGKYSPGKYKIVVPPQAAWNPEEQEAWEDSKALASQLILGGFKPDGTFNSYYAPAKSTPSWRTKLVGAVVLGKHKFGYLKSEDPKYRTTSQKPQPQETYTVQKGDNGISYVAKRLISSGKYKGETVKSLTDKIISANNFKGSNPVIKLGQKLILPRQQA